MNPYENTNDEPFDMGAIFSGAANPGAQPVSKPKPTEPQERIDQWLTAYAQFAHRDEKFLLADGQALKVWQYGRLFRRPHLLHELKTVTVSGGTVELKEERLIMECGNTIRVSSLLDPMAITPFEAELAVSGFTAGWAYKREFTWRDMGPHIPTLCRDAGPLIKGRPLSPGRWAQLQGCLTKTEAPLSLPEFFGRVKRGGTHEVWDPLAQRPVEVVRLPVPVSLVCGDAFTGSLPCSREIWENAVKTLCLNAGVVDVYFGSATKVPVKVMTPLRDLKDHKRRHRCDIVEGHSDQPVLRNGAQEALRQLLEGPDL